MVDRLVKVGEQLLRGGVGGEWGGEGGGVIAGDCQQSEHSSSVLAVPHCGFVVRRGLL